MSSVDMVAATDKTLQLHDGRTLGYAEYGSSEGKPLFYFHGHPGSRFEARFLAEQAAQVGVRLIGIDRPGMGLSSYKAMRRLLDWPDDVVELADSLHLDRFAVVGFSGGGPYALACASTIPQPDGVRYHRWGGAEWSLALVPLTVASLATAPRDETLVSG